MCNCRLCEPLALKNLSPLGDNLGVPPCPDHFFGWRMERFLVMGTWVDDRLEGGHLVLRVAVFLTTLHVPS